MDGQDVDSDMSGPQRQGSLTMPQHRIRHTGSILTLVISNEHIFGGTQNGEILKWHLQSYNLIEHVAAHTGTVLCLVLSGDQRLLFSSAGDAIVNVWDTSSMRRLYSISSTYDVGDVFCVAYSSISKTVFLGAQNTSIQWVELREETNQPAAGLSTPRPHRSHRFFDSKARGDDHVEQPVEPGPETSQEKGQLLEIGSENILQYAHHGYVYCMLLPEAVGPDNQRSDRLISGGGDGTIKLWGRTLQKAGALCELAVLDNGDCSVFSMALDGTLLYASLLEGEVNVWDLETRQLVRNIRASKLDVLTLVVIGELVFTGAACGTVKAFNRRNECLQSWKAHDGLVLASAITWYQGRLLCITGGNDNCVAIWDITQWAATAPGGSPTSNDQMVESLARLVAFRTVSSDIRFVEDCRRGATSLRNLFKRFGADTKILSTPANLNPIVYARFSHTPIPARDAKRILFYGHYDVIAADESKGNWSTDPFCLAGINGYLYGRGASDNKGPIVAALYAAAELATAQKLGADVVFLIEGDEECGSRGFEETIRSNKGLVGDIDWILIANSYWLDDDLPCLTYGHRGVIHARVLIEGDHADLHSGVNGSSLMDEPLKDLVMLLSKLTGPQGSVQIPGLYDSVPALTAAERRRYAAITLALQKQDPGLGDADDFTLSLMRRWREPSLTFHRFKVSGPENASVIPRSAQATLSVRLVPNQETSKVREMLVEFLKSAFEQLQSKNHLRVEVGHQADPWLGDPENELFHTLEDAIVEVWRAHNADVPGKARVAGATSARTDATSRSIPERTRRSPAVSRRGAGTPASDKGVDAGSTEAAGSTSGSRSIPLYIREGGSIPAIRFLEKTFGAPAANLPCGQASDNAHLDHERLRLTNLYNSRDIFKKVFQ